MKKILIFVSFAVFLLIFSGCGIQVPNVVGMTEDDAVSKIKEAPLNYKIKYEYTDSVDSNLVFSQSPKANTNVKSDKDINIYVSLGKWSVVPDIVGILKLDAEKILKQAGLKYIISEDYNESIEKGFVVSQKISKGEKVEPNTTVEITVSKGSKIIIESFIGENKTQAISYLKELGLNCSISGDYSSTIEKDCVVDYNPKTADLGDIITITISLGEDTRINVPSQVGKKESDAVAKLEELGLYVSVIYSYEKCDCYINNAIVVSQNTTGKVNPGSSIILTVSIPSIKIVKVDIDLNSVGGVDVTITTNNLSDMVINYIEFETCFYNRVGDPAICSITNSNKMTLQYVGPLSSGKTNESYWEAVIYNSTTACLDFQEIIVTFSDGRTQTLTYDGYWYNNDYVGGAPRS